MSLEKLLNNALIITGDSIKDLSFYRDPNQGIAADQIEDEHEDTINLDPVECSLNELLDEPETPSFIAYSEKYIYYFIRTDLEADDRDGVLRIIPRGKGKIVELDYRIV